MIDRKKSNGFPWVEIDATLSTTERMGSPMLRESPIAIKCRHQIEIC
jgi:hypothetical protein